MTTPDVPTKTSEDGLVDDQVDGSGSRRAIKMEPGWKAQLEGEFKQEYMLKLRAQLSQRGSGGATIYPSPDNWFTAFNLTPFNDVKVVILGQDPYHGPNQAHGLCFSVLPGVRIPPSLRNIYKELQSDLGIEPVQHGFLESWAKQGVFLLNSVLTVEDGAAASHQGLGWEEFTDAVIDVLNRQTSNTVFMLCKHFSQANEYLKSSGKQSIDWQLPTVAHVTAPAAN